MPATITLPDASTSTSAALAPTVPAAVYFLTHSWLAAAPGGRRREGGGAGQFQDRRGEDDVDERDSAAR